LADALGVGVAEFLPVGDTRAEVSANRMKREAGVRQLVPGLSDRKHKGALARVKALAALG